MKKINALKNSLIIFTALVTIISIFSCNEESNLTNGTTQQYDNKNKDNPMPPVYVYVKQNGNCNNSSIAYVTCYDLTDGSKSSNWTDGNGLAVFGILNGHHWAASAYYDSHYGCMPNEVVQTDGGTYGTLCLDDLQCRW